MIHHKQWQPLSGQCKKTNIKKLYKFTKHHLSYRSDQYLSRARLFNHKIPQKERRIPVSLSSFSQFTQNSFFHRTQDVTLQTNVSLQWLWNSNEKKKQTLQSSLWKLTLLMDDFILFATCNTEWTRHCPGMKKSLLLVLYHFNSTFSISFIFIIIF